MSHPPPSDADFENADAGNKASLSNDPSSTNGASPPNRSQPLGAQSVRGAAWIISFAMAGKVVAMALRFLLLAILVPEDLGIYALATTVTCLAIVGSTSLESWLVHRTRTFYQDAGQVFWLCLTLGVGMALLLAAASPLAGLVYGDMTVTLVILVSAAGVAVSSIPVVYNAALQHTLRFGSLAAIQFSRLVIEAICMILLAKMGWGPFSIVVPQAVIGLYAAAASRLAAGRLKLDRPHPETWMAILRPTIWLMFFNMATQARNSAPYVAAGIIYTKMITGYLSLGTWIAIQSVFVLATGLRGMFFATLAKLNSEPDRQTDAALRGMQTLLIIMAPVCLLQALLAGPLIDFLIVKQWLPVVAKWLPSVPVIIWLSLGMITQPIVVMSSAALMARGRFRLLTFLTAGSTGLVVLASLIGAWIGYGSESPQNYIAACVAMTIFFTNIALGKYTFSVLERGSKNLMNVLWSPFMVTVLAGLVGMITSQYFSDWGVRWQVGSVFLATVISYSVLIYLWLPEIALDIVKRLKGNPNQQTHGEKNPPSV